MIMEVGKSNICRLQTQEELMFQCEFEGKQECPKIGSFVEMQMDLKSHTE